MLPSGHLNHSAPWWHGCPMVTNPTLTHAKHVAMEHFRENKEANGLGVGKAHGLADGCYVRATDQLSKVK